MKLSLCYWNQTRKLRSDGALCRNHDDDDDENGPVERGNIATKYIRYIEKNITWSRGRRQKYNVERRAMRHFSVPDTTGLGSGAGRARQ